MSALVLTLAAVIVGVVAGHLKAREWKRTTGVEIQRRVDASLVEYQRRDN